MPSVFCSSLWYAAFGRTLWANALKSASYTDFHICLTSGLLSASTKGDIICSIRRRTEGVLTSIVSLTKRSCVHARLDTYDLSGRLILQEESCIR